MTHPNLEAQIDMELFDELPSDVRRAIANLDVSIPALPVLQRLQAGRLTPEQMITALQGAAGRFAALPPAVRLDPNTRMVL